MTLVEHDFGRDLEFPAFRMGVWHSRESVKAGFFLEGASHFERTGDVFERAEGASLGLSLSWRPPSWGVGLFAEAQTTHLLFEESTTLTDRRLLGVSAGLEFTNQVGIAPSAAFRVGYTRLFGATASRHGLLLAIDYRFWHW